MSVSRVFKRISEVSGVEQIYSIPVNEAFDRVRGGKECACPFCVLYNKLEEDELDIILGASMMEPDIRIKTNEQGFCDRHFARMLKEKECSASVLLCKAISARFQGCLKARV